LETGPGIAKGPLVVDALRRFLQSVWIDVRGQDRDIPIAKIRHRARERDGDRIRLLAAAAAGAPDAQAFFTADAVANQLRQHLLLEALEARLVAEEIRFSDGQMTREDVDLRLRDGAQQQLLRARGRILAAELWRSLAERALQIDPALRREVQT